MASFIINKKKKYKFNVEVCLEELLEVPFVSAVLFAKLRHDASNFVGHSSREEVRDHKVAWHAQFSFPCKMSANASTGVLDRCVLRISVRKECKGGRSFTKLGFVDLNLAEYAGSVVLAKKALLEGYDTRHRLDNSMLKFSIKVHLLSGDTIFKVPSPSLKSEEVLAEDNTTDNRLLDEFSSVSLAGSIASGSSGFGSLTKKRPPLLQSELVIGASHPPYPATTTSDGCNSLGLEDQLLPCNQQPPHLNNGQPQALGASDLGGGQLHLEHLDTASCEPLGHSRNSSNTSQMSKASGYSSGMHSRQSSSGDSGHIRNPSSGSLVVSDTGSLDRPVKVSATIQAQSVAQQRRKHPSSSTAEEADCVPAGRVEGTRVDVDDFISELLTQTNLNPIDDSNEMFDASGSPSYGFTCSNNMWLGSPFQCRDIQNRKRFELNHCKTENRINDDCDFSPFPLAFTKIHMKHNSSLQINTNMPLDKYIQLGLCIPKSCESYHITKLLETYFENCKNFPFQHLFNTSMLVLNAKVLREDTSWIFYEFKTVALLILAVPCVLFVILATFIDTRYYKNDLHVVNSQGVVITKAKNNKRYASVVTNFLKRNSQLIQCFSIKHNLKLILNTSLSKNSLPALHGLRFFGMIWIINVHSIFYGVDYFANVPQGFRLAEMFVFQIYSNSSYCVDTFFFISGFLLAYLFYKQKYQEMFAPKKCKLSAKLAEYFLLYANRFLRLIFPYVITILLTDVSFTYFRETSVLHSSESPDITCSKFCWRNILFINNLFPRSEMCLSWSWYLSIDSQFFLIGTFLLILSTMFFKVAAALLFFLMFAVMITTGLVCYNINYIPTLDDQLRELDAIYDLPWNRMGPYLVGIIFGYILVIKLKGQLELSRSKLFSYWILFPSLNFWIVFGIYGRQISDKFSAIYMGISRTFWGVGVGWIIMACSTNNGGKFKEL